MAKHELQHEAAELSADVSRNYELFKNESQERNERGQLTCPLAQTFEHRMNNSLKAYGDVAKALGRQAVYSSYVEVPDYGD